MDERWLGQQFRDFLEIIMKIDKEACPLSLVIRLRNGKIFGGDVMGPVTTNPWLIAVINMVIVFGVLIALGVLMSMIQVVDPTKNH